jgi:hypothetical protein
MLVASGTLWAAPAATEEAPPTSTWNLREHYSFEMPAGALIYNAAEAEWAIAGADGAMLIEGARTEVRLGDGAVLVGGKAGAAECQREKTTDTMGAGNRIYADVPLGQGLMLHHSLRTYRSRPFALLDVSVENRGAAPVTIAAINPAVILPGKAAGFSSAAQVLTRPLRIRGSHAVYDPAVPGLTAAFYDPQAGASLFLGALPWSPGRTEMRLEHFEGQWQGGVSCTFDPPVVVQPGETLASDTLFISFGLLDWGQVRQNFSFAAAQVLPVDPGTTPPLWVTEVSGGSAQALLDAVDDMTGTGVRHVLIPYGWEGASGSYDGGPGYPHSMKELVEALKGKQMTVGLSVDALATTDKGAGTIEASDGQRWIDPTSPEGREIAIAQLTRARSWGLGFFVVVPSAIPDDTLLQLNITREQAEHATFAAARAIGEDTPVFPASAAAVGPGTADWLRASAAVARLREYGLSAGPARLDLDGLEAMDEALYTAMTLYGGPLELVGRPGPNVRNAVARLAQRPVLHAYPVDFADAAPTLWRVAVNGPDGAPLGEGVVAFPGRPSWSLDDLAVSAAAGARVWTVQDGKFAEYGDAPVPGADRLQFYGITPGLARPALVGAPTRPDMMLQEVAEVRWDEVTGELSGRFAGTNPEAATAYVYLPAEWAFKEGKAGEKAVEKNGDSLVALDVPAGEATVFSLLFIRR